MKPGRWIAALLLAAGFLVSTGMPCFQQQDGGDLGGFNAFREERLQLPERHESTCPVAGGDIIETWGVSPTELEILGPAVRGAEGDGSGKDGTQSPAVGAKALAESRLVKKRDFDLDGDGTREEYSLGDGVLRVRVGSRLIWQSAEDWWVDYFFLGDANNDGLQELNLLVWKEGSFGPHRPFWMEEDDPGIKNHLFLFRLEEDEFKPVWQSSNLDRPNYRAALIDSDGDGERELLAIEGTYTENGELQATLWKWNGWGFSRLQ